MDVTATVNSDNTTLQTQGAPSSGNPGVSTTDAALFAALMALSSSGSAPVSGAPATSLETKLVDNQSAAPLSDLSAVVPIRFTVTPNNGTPNDSALEDFAVQMGIDRSLAHLLLTQTTQAPHTGKHSDSIAGDPQGELPTSSPPLTINAATAAGVVAPIADADAVTKIAPTSQVAAPTSDSKKTNLVTAIDTQAGIVNLNEPLSPTLSDEDLLKAKKAKSHATNELDKSRSNNSIDALSSLMKLSQEAKFTPVIDLSKATTPVTPESISIDSPLLKSANATNTNSEKNSSDIPGSNLVGIKIASDVFKLSRDSDTSQVKAGLAQSVNANNDQNYTVLSPAANISAQTAPVSGLDTRKIADPSPTLAINKVEFGTSVNASSSMPISETNSTQTINVSPQTPAIMSQDWLRSMGAQTSVSATTAPEPTPEFAFGEEIPEESTINILAGANQVISNKKEEMSVAVKPPVLARTTRANDQNSFADSLHNITLEASSKTTPLAQQKTAILPDLATSSIAQVNGQRPDLHLGTQFNGSQYAEPSARPYVLPAEATLNTPIELPRPDKSYETRMEEFSSQVASRLLAQVKTEKYEVNIKLTPESLGPISISINMDGNKLNAHFGAAVPEVRALLQAALPSLKSNLESAGFNLGNASFSQSGLGSGASFANQSGSNTHSMRTASQATIAKTTPEEAPGAAVSSGNSPHVLDVYA